VLEDGAILIRDGSVLHVGSEIPLDLLDNTRTVQFSGTLVPGFVRPHGYLGQENDLAETVSAFTPDLMAVDAFDPYGKSLVEDRDAATASRS
jgi:imidazolonepropionase-like amidohydrolase